MKEENSTSYQFYLLGNLHRRSNKNQKKRKIIEYFFFEVA